MIAYEITWSQERARARRRRLWRAVSWAGLWAAFVGSVFLLVWLTP